MKTLRIIIIFCGFLLISLTAQSQEKGAGWFFVDPPEWDGRWLTENQDIPILEAMKLVYTKPEGLNEVMGYDTFDDYPGLREILMNSLYHLLYSDDEEFIASFPLYYEPYSKEYIDSHYSIDDRFHPNIKYEGQIRGFIRRAYGTEASENWKDYVEFYSPEDAKRIFNADNAIRFTIELEPENYYKEKYKNLEILVIEKKYRLFVNLICFYTDKAKENLPFYWEKVESIFRYED